ncbi:hypothetical protein T11_2406 [Trichinella zimbabwensis]|uniref:HTH psq-type domain-containing protein n=1 Tax=Trichinella zimbabwensis TaxID=268475 RepID=A0A0V1GRY5_9BILA|nr:hypothetical protein T11_2406 [Trichinella zimbabwensis]
MSTTRSGKDFSLDQRREVCKRVDSSESFMKIARNFGVGVSIISYICHSRRQLTLKNIIDDVSKRCMQFKEIKGKERHVVNGMSPIPCLIEDNSYKRFNNNPQKLYVQITRGPLQF